jgi:hypothetical protein
MDGWFMSDDGEIAGAQREPHKWRIATVCLIALAFGGLFWAAFHTRERTFRGKPESWWFTNITYFAQDDEVKQWRSYGPDGVNVLIRALEKGNAPLDRTWANVWPRIPWRVRQKLPAPADFGSIRMCAASMLTRLGPDARAAVPAFLHNLQVERRDSVRQVVLGYFEQPPPLTEKEMTSLFSEFVQAAESRDSGVRNNAVVALRNCTNRLDVVMPIMLRTLHDPAVGVRLTTAKMLDELDHQVALKAGIVQITADCLANPNPMPDVWVPNEAVFFLGRLHSNPEISVPPLIASLSHKDSYVRGNAAWSLGRFGSGAKAAVPALQKALEDSDAYVRKQATNALKSIDSGTIATAGPAK